MLGTPCLLQICSSQSILLKLSWGCRVQPVRIYLGNTSTALNEHLWLRWHGFGTPDLFSLRDWTSSWGAVGEWLLHLAVVPQVLACAPLWSCTPGCPSWKQVPSHLDWEVKCHPRGHKPHHCLACGWLQKVAHLNEDRLGRILSKCPQLLLKWKM